VDWEDTGGGGGEEAGGESTNRDHLSGGEIYPRGRGSDGQSRM